MRTIDADALSAFVGDLRSTLHKEQSTFKAMTELEFNTRDYMLLNFQYAIDNAPTVEYPEQVTIKCDTEEDKQKLLSVLRNVKLKAVVEEERPHGKWIEVTQKISDSETSTYWECSICREPDRKYGKSKFCCECGADMRKEEEG